MLAAVPDNTLEPLALSMDWAVWARRAEILDRLDRAAGVLERAGHAADHLLARQRGVLLAALLVQSTHFHPAALLIDRQRRLQLAQCHQRQAVVRVGQVGGNIV